MHTRQVTHADLQNGDRVWVQGYLFEVVNVRTHPETMPFGEYGPGRPVVRFEGRVVDPTSSIFGTGYDGGTYGAFAWVPCHVATGAN